jgi:hypothetical protein
MVAQGQAAKDTRILEVTTMTMNSVIVSILIGNQTYLEILTIHVFGVLIRCQLSETKGL